MRVILDTNVLISYLLAPEKPRTITYVVEACFTESIELVMPEELLDELRTSIAKSTYLNQRIAEAQVDQFVASLKAVAITPAKLADTFPEYTADPDDDYLVAYAVVHEIDYLVTGDPHLLVLNQVRSTGVVLPAVFLQFLKRNE